MINISRSRRNNDRESPTRHSNKLTHNSLLNLNPIKPWLPRDHNVVLPITLRLVLIYNDILNEAIFTLDSDVSWSLTLDKYSM